MFPRIALVIVLIEFAAPHVYAGPSYTLGQKATCAESAVEIELRFDNATSISGKDRVAGGRAKRFPDELVRAAMANARVVKVFFGSAAQMPKDAGLYLKDQLWWKGYEQGRVRAIVFVRTIKDRPEVYFGVEGVTADVAPGYADIRSAIEKFAEWRDPKREGAAVSEAEKMLAGAKHDDVVYLAWEYLCSKHQESAIERAAMATPSGSRAATFRNYLRGKNYPICPAEPKDCSSW